jgi:hypothetical protein
MRRMMRKLATVGDRSHAGGSVIVFPRAAIREPWLSKRQIADYFGRSTRWVELRVREGLLQR